MNVIPPPFPFDSYALFHLHPFYLLCSTHHNIFGVYGFSRMQAYIEYLSADASADNVLQF